MLEEIKVGDPFDSETDIGPLVTLRQRERVCEYIDAGVREGARLVVGGTESGWHRSGLVRAPDAFADVDNGMRIARGDLRSGPFP